MEICRAITFINYNIPVTSEVDLSKIQYATVGFFDGMMTEKIIINDSYDEWKNLWRYTVRCTSNCKGHYSYQNVFCFGEDDLNEIRDEDFWNKSTDEEFPLTFVVFLQLKDYLNGVAGIKSQYKKFNEKAKEILGNEGRFYTYSTVDKNDFVICLKCKRYESAVNAIKNLHKIDQEVIYSYSVFSVMYDVLDHFDEETYPKIYEEKVKSICFKGVANSFNTDKTVSLDQKYAEFCEKFVDKIYGNEKGKADYKIYDILGEDDFRLIARDVSIGKLICQLGKNGMLCNMKDSFRFYLFSSTLVVNTETPADNRRMITQSYFSNNVNAMNSVFQAPNCNELQMKMDELSKIVNEDTNKFDEKIVTFCNAIWQLLQSLKALEIPNTKQYDFWSLYFPLSVLVMILEEKIKNANQGNDADSLRLLGYKEDIFDFIHKISMTLHGTLRTDIQFFQIRDFNATVHYAPAKLRAFYALWTLQISEFYNAFCKVKNTYSFIFSPGMFPIASVKRLFREYQGKKRLMLITLPERQLYSPKLLTVILAHEVSHCVGYEVRQRKVRHEVWLKMCARVLVLEMNYYRYSSCPGKWRVQMEQVIAKSELLDQLNELLFVEEAKIRVEKNLYPHEFHSENSEKIINEAFIRVSSNMLKKLVKDDCEIIIRRMLEIEERSQAPINEKIAVKEEIRKIAYESEQDLMCMAQRFLGAIPQFIESFKHILIEACADVNAVLSLELEPEEYIYTFCKAENFYGPENMQNKSALLVIVRMELVIEAVQKKIEGESGNGGGNGFINSGFVEKWKNFQLAKLAWELPKNSVEGITALSMYSYADGRKNCNDNISVYKGLFNPEKYIENFSKGEFDFFNDKIIWQYMLEYVSSCVGRYLDIIGENAELIEKKRILTNAYQNISKDSMLTTVQEIENFLYQFEKNSCKNLKNEI